MKLSDKVCKSAKSSEPPSKAPRKLADGQGLYLWVMPNGAKYWRFTYRINGKQKTQALGVYPEVSLKDARNKRMDARKLVSEGKDPVLERKRTKTMAAQNAANTFEAVAREWYENRKDHWTRRYAEGVIKRLENDIFPEISEGKFPQNVNLGARSVGWLESEIDAWMQACIMTLPEEKR